MKFGVIIMEKLAQWKYLATEWVIPDTTGYSRHYMGYSRYLLRAISSRNALLEY